MVLSDMKRALLITLAALFVYLTYRCLKATGLTFPAGFNPVSFFEGAKKS
jgi:ABC-type uncharacterized transport system permease subunit